jgi:hypothetical protein
MVHIVDWVVPIVVLGFSVFLLWAGYRASRQLADESERLLLRTAVLAAALTPSLIAESPLSPAWWVVVRGDGLERLTDGLFPIALMWPTLYGLSLGISYLVHHPDTWHLHHRH